MKITYVVLACIIFVSSLSCMNEHEKHDREGWLVRANSFFLWLSAHFPKRQEFDKLDPLALNRACQWMDEKQDVVLFIQNGANVNLKDKRGMTPLHWAALRGSYEICQLLIDNDADVNAIDNNERTPMHHAAENGRVQTVRLLAERHADIDCKDVSDYTPIHYAVSRRQGKAVEELVKKKVKLNLADYKGFRPLHTAVQKDDTEIVRILLNAGADTAVTDVSEHKQPLHIAAGRGNIEHIALLLRNNASVAAQDAHGLIPLHYAVSGNHTEAVELLLKYGSNVDSANHDKQTPIFFALDKEVILKILLANNANIDVGNLVGSTPLHDAMKHSISSIKLLLSHNANHCAQNITGKTPWHYAADKGNFEALNFLASKYLFPPGWKYNFNDKESKVNSLKKACCLQIARSQEALFELDVHHVEIPFIYKYIVQESPLSIQRQLILEHKIELDKLIYSHGQRHLHLLHKIFKITDYSQKTPRDLANNINENQNIINLFDKILAAKNFNELNPELASEITKNIKKKIFRYDLLTT